MSEAPACGGEAGPQHLQSAHSRDQDKPGAWTASQGPSCHRGRPMGALEGGTWILSNAKEFFLRSHTKPRLMASSEASQLDVRNRKQPSDEVN